MILIYVKTLIILQNNLLHFVNTLFNTIFRIEIHNISCEKHFYFTCQWQTLLTKHYLWIAPCLKKLKQCKKKNQLAYFQIHLITFWTNDKVCWIFTKWYLLHFTNPVKMNTMYPIFDSALQLTSSGICFFVSGRTGIACCSPVYCSLVCNLTLQLWVSLAGVHQWGGFCVCSWWRSCQKMLIHRDRLNQTGWQPS